MKPTIIKGAKFSDNRGILRFNNDFNASETKRIYAIQNANQNFIRGWQGHKIEQRWFSAISGSFIIKLIKIDNWENPSRDLEILEFTLSSETLDFLHVPAGYISWIKSKDPSATLLLLADFFAGEINDEYRFPLGFFNKE